MISFLEFCDKLSVVVDKVIDLFIFFLDGLLHAGLSFGLFEFDSLVKLTFDIHMILSNFF